MENLEVLKSAAGFYLGTTYKDQESGTKMPNSRDSDYYNTREEAEVQLNKLQKNESLNSHVVKEIKNLFDEQGVLSKKDTIDKLNYHDINNDNTITEAEYVACLERTYEDVILEINKNKLLEKTISPEKAKELLSNNMSNQVTHRIGGVILTKDENIKIKTIQVKGKSQDVLNLQVAPNSKDKNEIYTVSLWNEKAHAVVDKVHNKQFVLIEGINKIPQKDFAPSNGTVYKTFSIQAKNMDLYENKNVQVTLAPDMESEDSAWYKSKMGKDDLETIKMNGYYHIPTGNDEGDKFTSVPTTITINNKNEVGKEMIEAIKNNLNAPLDFEMHKVVINVKAPARIVIGSEEKNHKYKEYVHFDTPNLKKDTKIKMYPPILKKEAKLKLEAIVEKDKSNKKGKTNPSL